jgi:hypothetical protein
MSAFHEIRGRTPKKPAGSPLIVGQFLREEKRKNVCPA